MPAKKKAVKKQVVKKKATVKKKAVAKKTAVKKKATVKKKVVAKKTAVNKKATVKNKDTMKEAKVTKKKVTTKKTLTAKKEAPVKKKTKVKKKATVKKTVAPKKKSTTTRTKKVTTEKSTTKQKTVPATNSKPQPVVRTHHKRSPIDNIPYIESYVEKEGEDYMGAEQKQHFRNILNTWKRDLMQEVDRTVGHMKDEAANFPDPADRATQEEEFSLELRTRDRERKLIKKIDEAIQRIEEDDYGYCEACGIEIGTKRLEARPTATLCIDCKTVDEIREKQLLA